MSFPRRDPAPIVTLRPLEGTARALLRYVDRSALDELTAAFMEAVGLPAAVRSASGEFVAGSRAMCPACGPDAPLDLTAASGSSFPTTGWVRCRHGLGSMVIPIRARTGEPLAAVAVGPMALSEADVTTLRRALLAQGQNERNARTLATQVTRSSAERAEAAARLLVRTFDTVVREAAIASENADLAATQRQANRELTVLYSVARSLGSGMELRTVLQRLVDAVGQQLGCDVALVGLIEGDELVTVASWGLLTFEARHGRLKVGEGLSGRVAATGKPLTCHDMQDDPRQYMTAINSREQLHAFAGVPIARQGETIGVLAIYQRVPDTIPESEVDLLAHIADQASAALERARLYEQERHTIGELRTLHAQVERQHQSLERATAVHEQLTQMVLRDAGLDAIVDSLARLLGLPVVVEDQFNHLLTRGAPSSTHQSTLTSYHEALTPNSSPVEPGEGRTSARPAEPGQAAIDAGTAHASAIARTHHLARVTPDTAAQFDVVRRSRRPESFPATPEAGLEHPRVVAPVIVGGDLLGFLTVIERDRPLEDPDLLAIGHATTVIALEMMKQRTRAEVERRLRGELLEELIASGGHDAETMLRRAAYLGYNLAAPHALFVFAPEQSVRMPGAENHGNRSSVTSAIEAQVGARLSGAMVLSRVDGTVVATPLRDGTVAEARSIAEALKRDVQRAESGLPLVTMGRICRTPDDFAVAFREAKRAITLARSLGVHDRVMAFEDLGVYRLLLDLPRASDAVQYADELLAPLAAYDSEHESNLVATLEAWLEANGTLQQASRALSIHVNTLTYRLQRIRELTGIDLNDSDSRLGLHLAVKIRQAIALSLGEKLHESRG